MSPLTLGFATLWAFLLSHTTCCYCPPVFKLGVLSSMQSLNLFFLLKLSEIFDVQERFWFLKDLFLLNKRKYNILGVWKQTEILVTDIVLVLSLQIRIWNIFSFFLDAFYREIHFIYGSGKYLKTFLTNSDLVCKSDHHLQDYHYLKQHLFFFVLSAYLKGWLVVIRRFYIHKYCTYEVDMKYRI